jgi:hypothetical protein
VRREDLEDFSASDDEILDSTDTAALRDALNARMAGLLTVGAKGVARTPAAAPVQKQASRSLDAVTRLESVEAGGDDDHAQPEVKDDAAEETSFSFRLFATANDAPTPRIILTPERELLSTSRSEGDAVRPVRRRPLSYYIKPKASGQQLERFQAAAQTAEDIRIAAGQRNWGLEVPWRVTDVVISAGAMQKVLRVSRTGLSEVTEHRDEEVKIKRRRPGKTGRIRLRTREKTRVEKAAEEEKQKVSKEEHLKEKKKRLNRERKLKRRQKERDKKASNAQSEKDEVAPRSDSESDS